MLRRPTDSRFRMKIAERRHAVADSVMARHPYEDRPKPFAKVSFYLDLKDYLGLKKLINDIKNLGGSVETFLSKDVKYVITNRPNWKQHFRNGALDDGSLPSTPNSLSNTKSGAANDSPFNLESPKKRNIPSIATSRASAMLEKARKSATKGSSDVLQIARLWGVKVLSLTTLCNIIKKSKSQYMIRRSNNMKDISRMKLKQSLKTHLVNPFMKFEDINREYRPQYRQFREWPALNLNTGHMRSPFAKAASKKSSLKAGVVQQKFVSSSLPSEGNLWKNKSIGPFKNVAMVTQSTNSSTCTESKKIEVEMKPGFCEMCLTRYADVYAHIKGKEHQEYLKEPGFYTILDKKIAALPDIFTFAKMVAHRLSSNSGSHTRSSTLATSNENKNLGENFCIPMPKPAFRKRKYHTDACQLSKKKQRAPAASIANNAENCKPNPARSANLPALEQCSRSPKKLKCPKAFKQLYTENCLSSKDSFVGKQICDSKNSTPFKRKVLEPLDVNAINTESFRMCEIKKLQKRSPGIQTQSGEKANRDEKPENVKVLRSTAMRRISACQTSTKAASSPSFRSSVLVNLLDSRKANSSPIDCAFAKQKRGAYGVCRALDLGDPHPVPRRKSFLDSSQKLKNLLDECDASLGISCLESVLNAPNHEALSNMPFLECVQPVSPLTPEPESRLLPVPPTLDLKCDLGLVMDVPLTPDCTGFSKDSLNSGCPATKPASTDDATECGDISTAADSNRPITDLSSSDEVAVSRDEPSHDGEVSRGHETAECCEHVGLVVNSVQVAEASLVDKSEEAICAIEKAEAPNCNTPLDLSSKRNEYKSSSSFQNLAAQDFSKNAESECSGSAGVHSTLQPSQSSVFNLISSPSLPRHSKVLTDAAAIPRSESSIPRFIFKRIRGDKHTKWTVRVLSDDTGAS